MNLLIQKKKEFTEKMLHDLHSTVNLVKYSIFFQYMLKIYPLSAAFTNGDILLFLVLVLFATTSHAARGNLYEKIEDYYEIKVFLKDVVDDSGNANVDVFRDIFKGVLKDRKQITFIPVNDAASADVVVNIRIEEYTFTEDPIPVRAVPIIMMPMVAAADIAEPKSSAKLVVE